jgi:hypothetical protein
MLELGKGFRRSCPVEIESASWHSFVERRYRSMRGLLEVKPVRGQPQTTSKRKERPNPEDATQLALQAFQAKPEADHDKKWSYHQPDHTM